MNASEDVNRLFGGCQRWPTNLVSINGRFRGPLVSMSCRCKVGRCGQQIALKKEEPSGLGEGTLSTSEFLKPHESNLKVCNIILVRASECGIIFTRVTEVPERNYLVEIGTFKCSKPVVSPEATRGSNIATNSGNEHVHTFLIVHVSDLWSNVSAWISEMGLTISQKQRVVGRSQYFPAIKNETYTLFWKRTVA